MSTSKSAGLEPGPAQSGPYTTPTKRAAFASSAEAGPSRARPAGASPAYSSRRHSLYGIEDRVVIDPGSRIWKVGFSGEPEPRAVFFAQDVASSDRTGATEAWDLDLESMMGVNGSRSEGDRLVGARIVKKLRDTYVKHLLADSKARKVIILENTFLPNYVKEHIASALFDNLQVPSVSFTSSSLLALVACGKITGLVVDAGWLETTITPVYHSRPLYTMSRSTPLAGRKLHLHLRNLLHHHAVYIPPPSSMSTIRSRERIEGVPLSILTDQVVERVLTEGCFVGGIVVDNGSEQDVAMEVDESEADDVARSEEEKSRFRRAKEEKRRYAHTSSAKDMSFVVSAPVGSARDMVPGSIIVPGWIRERAAEILFNDDDEAEDQSIPRIILACLLKLPIDLRASMFSSILVIGGTPSLPGFIPRLRIALLHHLLPPPTGSEDPNAPRSPLNTPAQRMEEVAIWKKRSKDEPYQTLYRLSGQLSILNDPAPLDGDEGSRGGRAPRWTPGLISWVGGSLAGSLKTSSPEMTRETYDTFLSVTSSRGEAYREELEAAEVEVAALAGVSVDQLGVGEALNDVGHLGRKRGWRDGVGLLGDWSRSVKA
ncbi:hypothetical protein I317_00199 [Kwoniella heveanensis CBS 569]|nr:hypothetical protein I317_00199 [Kwoniella heveanensis CBS 569]